uniref:C-type lectin domain-containing protein n=1 Tax=Nothobranchius furzeri TaxID=105023 RepID=A0A8C6LKY8_NOTFU
CARFINCPSAFCLFTKDEVKNRGSTAAYRSGMPLTTYLSGYVWTDAAQFYCQQHYKDLAVIENNAEYTQISQIKLSQPTVWIGLYRVPWTWSDKSQSSFRNWSPNGIDNNGNEYCASENDQHEWRDDKCDLPQVFICERFSVLFSFDEDHHY